MTGRLALFFLLLPFAAGCGYALVGTGSSLPPGIETVSIPLFENKTGEPDLDTIITAVVKEEFIKDGRLKVDDSAAADSVLAGVILGYNLRPLAYDAENNVTEYMVTLAIRITHIDKSNGETITSQRMNTNWRYEVNPSITASESLRFDAIETAAQRAAESIVSLVIESF
ncbi:MAG: LPS assembly lipoprotein LptE [Candidatus Nitrospinota bacterium M3_3B_026]